MNQIILLFAPVDESNRPRPHRVASRLERTASPRPRSIVVASPLASPASPVARPSRRRILSRRHHPSIHPSIRAPSSIFLACTLQNTIRIRVQYTYTHHTNTHEGTRVVVCTHTHTYTQLHIALTDSVYMIHDRSVTSQYRIYRPHIHTRPRTRFSIASEFDRARCSGADDGAFESWRGGRPRDAIAVAVSSSRRRCRRRR